MSEPTCNQVIYDLDVAMREVLDESEQYFVLGGIATAAIIDPASIFDHDAKRLLAGNQSEQLGVKRENSTTRDIDILIKNVLTPDHAREIKQTIAEAIGRQLVVSVFGFDEHKEATGISRLGYAFSDWTSRRTIDAAGTLRYELHPIEQVVAAASFEPWTLEINPDGTGVSILNPAAHSLAYDMRSISGPRAKDAQKVDAMKRKIAREPLFVEQIMDGDLKTWRAFADTIVKTGDGVVELDNPLLHKAASRVDLLAFRAKAMLLRTLESKQVFVNLAQQGTVQTLLEKIVRAK